MIPNRHVNRVFKTDNYELYRLPIKVFKADKSLRKYCNMSKFYASEARANKLLIEYFIENNINI